MTSLSRYATSAAASFPSTITVVFFTFPSRRSQSLSGGSPQRSTPHESPRTRKRSPATPGPFRGARENPKQSSPRSIFAPAPALRFSPLRLGALHSPQLPGGSRPAPCAPSPPPPSLACARTPVILQASSPDRRLPEETPCIDSRTPEVLRHSRL